MKDTSSCVERVLHRTAQQGSSRTNVCLLNILQACPRAQLLNGQTYLVLNFSGVTSPGKEISLIKYLWLKFQGFVLANIVKASKPSEFEIRIAVLKTSQHSSQHSDLQVSRASHCSSDGSGT